MTYGNLRDLRSLPMAGAASPCAAAGGSRMEIRAGPGDQSEESVWGRRLCKWESAHLMESENCTDMIRHDVKSPDI